MLAHRFYPVAIFCYRLLVIHCSCHETVKMDIGIQINWREQNTVNIQHTFNDYLSLLMFVASKVYPIRLQ